MIPYHLDQLHKDIQQEAEAAHELDRWEQGHDDGLANVWNCCPNKTEQCSRYCKYLAGYQWGLEQATIEYHAQCASNLAVLDSEEYDEF